MKKNKKGKFSKWVVIFCIVEMMLVQMWGMWIADKDALEVNSLVATNHAVFGGELILLCLKRLFATEDGGINKHGSSKDNTDKIQ